MSTLLISLQDSVDIVSEKYLHYFLLKNDINSTLLMLPHLKVNDKKILENILSFICSLSPGYIGISLMSNKFCQAADLTLRLKEKFPSIPVIWGGIHPTISPETCLDYCDYVCIGEGENTLLDIALSTKKNKPIKNIKNLCYIENGKLKKNKLYPPIHDLDSIPFFDHVPLSSFLLHRKRIVPVNAKIYAKHARFFGGFYNTITSRGCPFSCTYCCNNFLSRLYSKKIRRRSIENIISELEKAVKNNSEIEYINLLDDCFLACSYDYLSRFCKIYRQKINKPFVAKAIPLYLSREKIEMLTDAGLAWIELGLQSGSDRILKDIYKRKTTQKEFLSAANIINEFKIAAYYDVILDNPFETVEDRIETIKTLMETPKPSLILFFSLTFYPGTELYDLALKKCPEKIEDPFKKDYFNYRNNIINIITRLSSFLQKKQIMRILDLYIEGGPSIKFKLTLLLARIYSFIIVEPVTYFKVIKRSQRGSFWKTIKVLKNYLRLGIRTYINRFTAKKGTL